MPDVSVPHWLIAALVFLTAAGSCAAAIQPIRRFALRFQLLDQLDPRKVHTVPIPRIAGLAIHLGFVLAVGVSFMLPVERFTPEIARIVLVLVGSTLVVSTMFFDDVFG